MHTYEILCFSNAQLAGMAGAISLVCLAAGYVVGRILGRRAGHDQGFGEGAAWENQRRREEEHKSRLQLWQDPPAHAAALLIGEIYTHYQPTPLMWRALGLALVGKFCKSKADFQTVRRRILEVTNPTFPRSRKSRGAR